MRPYRGVRAAVWRLRSALGLLLVWALSCGEPALAAMTVLYPELGEPYRTVFSEMIAGIREQARGPVSSYAIGASMDATVLREQLKRESPQVVIALGRQGIKAALQWERPGPVVVGGVLALPETEARPVVGISLTPAPDLLFARLKSLVPGSRRVIVICNPQANEWLLGFAREAAKAQELELVVHAAYDLASAAQLYKTAFASADKSRDAVWLLQDSSTLDEETIVPLVLENAWRRNVPVFSSSLLHVKKGVLFALFPDNRLLGRHLAQTAQLALAQAPSKSNLLPLRAVRTAVNLRTAGHLGLNIGYQQQRSFDAVFPEP